MGSSRYFANPQSRRNLSGNKVRQDVKKYKLVLQSLYAYLEKNPDQRLKARTLMFDVLGASEYDLQKTINEGAKVKTAIQIATQLNDDQLLAESMRWQGRSIWTGAFWLNLGASYRKLWNNMPDSPEMQGLTVAFGKKRSGLGPNLGLDRAGL